MAVNCPPCHPANECGPAWTPPPFGVDCLDFDNTDHVAFWNQAWATASSWVYDQTGQRWPGKCWQEVVRPCLPIRCHPKCDCYSCGRYSWIPIDNAFCMPLVSVESVTIYPNPCNPDTVVKTIGDGIRVEHVLGQTRLVLEDIEGCCGTFPRQDLCRPLGEDCTWTITAVTGQDPPAHILAGTVALANKMAEEWVANGCKLHYGTTSASFQGTSITIDPDGKSDALKLLRESLNDLELKPIESFLNPYDYAAVTFHHQSIDKLDPCPDAPVCDPPTPTLIIEIPETPTEPKVAPIYNV